MKQILRIAQNVNRVQGLSMENLLNGMALNISLGKLPILPLPALL
jgi:hypothetical protein